MIAEGWPVANHLIPVAVLAYIQQMRDAIGPKPRGFTAIGVFLFFGAVMASLAATTLLWRGTVLDRLWTFNPTAYKIKAQFSNDNRKFLLRQQIAADLLRLELRVHSFIRQLSDLAQIDILGQNDSFHFFRRLLNYDSWRIDGLPTGSHFLDYQVANSDVEAERDHLRVGDHFVRVLTIKEAISETKPLVLKQLLEIQANFCVVSEWVPIDNATARKEITKRRRHFNVSKSSFISSVRADAPTVNPRDILIDESKQADIENLGDCLRVLGDGQSLGEFSLTIVLYAEDKRTLDRVLPDVVRIFTSADRTLFSETYNQLNAYFATVPGNYRHNLRRHYLLNSNYADISFLFTIQPGETWNDHLDREYLAVLETDNATPYYLNLHNREVAHTLILGATGSGKAFLRKYVRKRGTGQQMELPLSA